jgi:hypothetical protein
MSFYIQLTFLWFYEEHILRKWPIGLYERGIIVVVTRMLNLSLCIVCSVVDKTAVKCIQEQLINLRPS